MPCPVSGARACLFLDEGENEYWINRDKLRQVAYNTRIRLGFLRHTYKIVMCSLACENHMLFK
jgi:hypothetical protein